jgi:hypothetical protein
MGDHIRSVLLEKVVVDGFVLEIDGYYNDSGTYEWYDVFHRGICLNEGDPFYQLPTNTQLNGIAEQLKKEYAENLWKPIENKEQDVLLYGK